MAKTGSKPSLSRMATRLCELPALYVPQTGRHKQKKNALEKNYCSECLSADQDSALVVTESETEDGLEAIPHTCTNVHLLYSICVVTILLNSAQK